MKADEIRARVRHELNSYAAAALYLFLCLGAIQFYADAVLRAEGVPLMPIGFAAIKALILAKFLLVGEALHLGERFERHPLIVPLVWRSVLFLLLLLALSALEVVVAGLLHGEQLGQIAGEIGGGTWMRRLAGSLLLWLVLLPYFAFRLTSNALGPGVLQQMFLGPR